MARWMAGSAAGALAMLAGCTTVPLPPTQVIRYHQDRVDRGTITVVPGTPQPIDGSPAAAPPPAGPEFQLYADAVRGALLRSGYADPAPGARAQLIASVVWSRISRQGPPRSSPISIGLGGGGFSGGGWRGGGGVGGGLGLGFPIGGTRPSELIVTELRVTIKRADGTPVWEGNAQTVADARRGADAAIAAQKLADAMFRDFPGQSGRTVEVK